MDNQSITLKDIFYRAESSGTEDMLRLKKKVGSFSMPVSSTNNNYQTQRTQPVVEEAEFEEDREGGNCTY